MFLQVSKSTNDQELFEDHDFVRSLKGNSILDLAISLDDPVNPTQAASTYNMVTTQMWYMWALKNCLWFNQMGFSNSNHTP